MGLLDSLNKVAYEESLDMNAEAVNSRIAAQLCQVPLPDHYDEVINLGFNCEISFRIQDYFGSVNSYLFSWIYSHDRELLLKSLDRLHEILEGDAIALPETNMIKFTDYNMSFHIKENRDELAIADGGINIVKAAEALAELKSRAGHLIDKTEALFNSDKTTLIVYKLKFTADESLDNDFINRLLDKLNEVYPSGKFTLLVVVESAHAHKLNLNEDGQLQSAIVPNFTNINNVNELDKANAGWQEIYDKYFSKVILGQ